MVSKLQAAFTGGELSPSLYSRIDLQKYQFGLKTCNNFFIHAHGGASNRPGFEYLGRVYDDSKAVRLIDFEFNTEQTYALEFGDQYMRVWKDGGLVLNTAQSITSISAASPAVVTKNSHGYLNGAWVYIAPLVGTMETVLEGKFFKVTNRTANTFQLYDLDGNAVDTTGLAFTSGSMASVYTLTTPYVEADLFLLKYVQSADTMTITHPDYAPRELTRTDHNAWSLTTITFGSTVTAPASGPTLQLSAAMNNDDQSLRVQYVSTAVIDGEESLASPASASTQTDRAWGSGQSIKVTVDTVTGADSYNVYKRWGDYDDGVDGPYGFIGRTDDDSNAVFHDRNFSPKYDETPFFSNKNPFSGAGYWPVCATYYQQRVIYGGTENNPQTIYATQTGNFRNMNVATPSKDDDAITYQLNSMKVNEIRHVVGLDKLIVFTSGSVWALKGDADGVFAPSTINGSEQDSNYGSAHVAPVVIGGTILFVTNKTYHVRAVGYSFESDSYAGSDMSILSAHLFEGRSIVDWCYQGAPYSLVWVVLDNGKMLCFTFHKEHQVQAWSRHETSGRVESVCAIAEGSEDAVYAVVKRKINGVWKRYVERLHSRVFSDVRDCFFVDSGLTYDPALAVEDITIDGDGKVTIEITAHGYSDGDKVDLSDIVGVDPSSVQENIADELNLKRFTVADSAANTFVLKDRYGNDYIDGSSFSAYESDGYARKAKSTFTGLDHLEGREVVALSDGGVVHNLTVTDGSITLPVAGSRVHIGLPYNADLETLDIDFETRDGGTFGKKKSVSHLNVKMKDSRGGFYGPSSDSTLYEMMQRSDEAWNEPTRLQTTEHRIALHGTWQKAGRVFIRQSDPLPITILSLTPEVTIGD